MSNLNSTNNRIIIITVPHGLCLARTACSTIRTCDLRAQQASNKLYEKLVLKNNYPTTLLSNIERAEHDLNRPWSREVPWRLELTKILKKLRQLGNDKEIILVDMHSFVGPIRRIDKYPDENFKNKKLALLDFKDNDITNNLLNKLKNSLGDDNVIFVPGSEVNDIQLTSRKYVNYSFLIENNEDKTIYTDKDLDKAMEIIADYLLEFSLPNYSYISTQYNNYNNDNTFCNIL